METQPGSTDWCESDHESIKRTEFTTINVHTKDACIEMFKSQWFHFVLYGQVLCHGFGELYFESWAINVLLQEGQGSFTICWIHNLSSVVPLWILILCAVNGTNVLQTFHFLSSTCICVRTLPRSVGIVLYCLFICFFIQCFILIVPCLIPIFLSSFVTLVSF